MKTLILIITFSVIAGIAGYIWGTKETANNSKFYAKAIRSGQAGYINPLLEYEVSDNLFGPELAKFDNDIDKLVQYIKKNKDINTVSVYFRSLNDGPWFGVNEDINYFPASLLKVPLMISYFKQSETNPQILGQEITYYKSIDTALGNFDNTEYYKPSQEIEVGKTYTVEDLIDRMIINSDNNAKNLLVLNLDSPQKLFNVYNDLGLATPPELRQGGDVLTVQEYATFFRVLYNASYLDKNLSNKALEILTKTDFNRGISAGVSDNVKVAHKFGEHSDDSFKQLHDCGIVYYPNRPYILCVMTRGKTFDGLENAISTISKNVYEHVDKEARQAGKQ